MTIEVIWNLIAFFDKCIACCVLSNCYLMTIFLALLRLQILFKTPTLIEFLNILYLKQKMEIVIRFHNFWVRVFAHFTLLQMKINFGVCHKAASLN